MIGCRGRNREPLDDRVARAAKAALAATDQVTPIDVLGELGWLHANAVKSWRLGQMGCLEDGIQVNPERLSEALRLLQSWAARNGLIASEASYVARTTERQTLQFSQSADPRLERLYRTHWVSSALPEKKRERLAEKQSRPPELVVVIPNNRDWTCHRCGGTGDILMMENGGPACLDCVGLGDLEYLPAGDALLTRRAKAKSARHAVVIRFSRNRRRYERQGLLVEPQALAEAESETREKRA